MMMQTAKELLRLDEARAIGRIEEYIKRLVEAHSANGVLLGLSGGIDSALVATLAVRALGKDRVKTYYLFDRDNEEESVKKARSMAEWLGLKLNIQSIESDLRKKKIYAPFIMQLSGISPFIVHSLLNFYWWMYKETPLVSTLRRDGVRGGRFKRWFFNRTIKNIEAGFNARDIKRREVLEAIAEKENLMLLCAGNRSEGSIGWFTQGGIDNLPFSPIAGLYKAQVRQLSEYLKLPDQIQHQKSSPDMLKGVTDEIAFGIDYEKIDIILDSLDRGLRYDDIAGFGFTKDEIANVHEMNRLSEWKRGHFTAKQMHHLWIYGS